MRELDRSAHELLAACAVGPPGAPTPTYEVLSDIPGLEMHPVDFGSELAGKSLGNKLRSLARSVRAIRSIAQLAILVRRRHVQIVHTSDRPRDAAACVLLASLTGAKCVIHVHVGFGEWMSPLLKWSLRRADALVAISEFVRQTLVASGHDATRTHVALNAIDPDAWHPGEGRDEVRREFGISDDAPVVITVCRLFPAKGPEEVIRSMPSLRRAHPMATLLVVGEEMRCGYRQHLAEVARDLGVGDCVHFTGYRHDIPKLMAASDIFALHSAEEPFGLVYLEAMAMRLPVVALATGATPEVVLDGVTGLLSKSGDMEGFMNNLMALVQDPARRRSMGRAGRQRVESDFTTRRMAADVETVYEQLTWVEQPAESRVVSV
ncbi:MAG: glycosyltransferase family 4 protein [Acidimicrobiaceae bacterium]|nr:glycosyltransferase family 4 protein [Acidimicrobiaceae bacterium]